MEVCDDFWVKNNVKATIFTKFEVICRMWDWEFDEGEILRYSDFEWNMMLWFISWVKENLKWCDWFNLWSFLVWKIKINNENLNIVCYVIST